MIYGIGNDIIEIQRIKDAVERNEVFLHKIYTEDELLATKEKSQSLAGNFAAKEAVAKAFGTGFRTFSAIDVEVLRDEFGKPYVKLYDGAKELYEKLELKAVHVTISHNRDHAIATCILEK